MENSVKSDSRDRLSELPNSLILVILSLLPMTDVVTTTLLSKRWRNLWTAVSCLHFWSRSDDLEKFRSFVGGALAVWKGPKLRKFSMDFLFHVSLTRDLDSWLLFAVEKQVEELYINLTDSKFYIGPSRDYFAPQCLYSCSSVRKLSLISCFLKISCEKVQWDELRSLTIECFYSLGERTMDHLLSGAPQLEILNLRSAETWQVDTYIESSSLKMLKIERHSSAASSDLSMQSVLSILAPNLETLEFYGASYGKCCLDVPSLTNAVLDFDARISEDDDDDSSSLCVMVMQVFMCISHVEKVTLSDWCTKILLKMNKEGLLGPFPNVKYLKFKASAASEILGVVEIFPKLMMLIVELKDLKYLIFTHCLDNFFKSGEEPNFITIRAESETIPPISPSIAMLHLRTIELTWHALDAAIIQCVEALLGNAPLLEKMVFRLRWHGAKRDLLHLAEEKVLSLPRSSPTAEVVIIKD